MDRVFESGAAAAPPGQPATPSTGYPTAGNPQTAVPATKPGPWWYHMVTEELRAVVAAAGIIPTHTDVGQLSTAIRRLIDGGDYKASVRVATTANIALTGEQTIDGVAVVAGDRVLVMAQTAGAENGIYIAATGAWARSTDADTAGDLTSGVLVPVESGTGNADTIWMLTTDGAITIGTTALTWQIKSGDASTARKGLVQLATSAEAQALTDALKTLTPATLAAALQGANQSIGTNGYQKLPGGLILQWGQAGTNGTGDTAVTFPIAFPNGVRALVMGTIGSGAGYMGVFNTLTNTGVNVGTWSATATRAGSTVHWAAIGN
ncbi:MAG: gp53-like domain-containing protein [Thiobacillus sp.]